MKYVWTNMFFHFSQRGGACTYGHMVHLHGLLGSHRHWIEYGKMEKNCMNQIQYLCLLVRRVGWSCWGCTCTRGTSTTWRCRWRGSARAPTARTSSVPWSISHPKFPLNRCINWCTPVPLPEELIWQILFSAAWWVGNSGWRKNTPESPNSSFQKICVMYVCLCSMHM